MDQTNSSAGSRGQKLLVTAYYSPLPDQSFYIRGSYEGDIRLNGRGTNGADGTPVYVGMLAAPKTYAFGTRIAIPGLGVGEVHDRGGAIVERQGYHRVDVWMGHGEEGLARALNWGARLVDGKVYADPAQVQPGLDFSWVSAQLPGSVISRLTRQSVQSPQSVSQTVTPVSSAERIKDLQAALATLGHYQGESNGLYDEATTRAVLDFQLASGVIPDAQAQGAGHYGPKTQSALEQALSGYNAAFEKEKQQLEEDLKTLASGLGKEAEGEDVKALQQMLWELGYYHGMLHGEYDQATIEAVFQFQREHGVLDSERELGAGFFGPKTQEALKSAFRERIAKLKDYPQQIQAWVPAERPLPLIASLTLPELRWEQQAIHFADELMRASEPDQEIAPEPVQAVFSGEMSPGDQGDQVALLQRKLAEMGLMEKELETGFYGAQTQQAVLAFQTRQGIVASAAEQGAGRVGPKTLEALNAL